MESVTDVSPVRLTISPQKYGVLRWEMTPCCCHNKGNRMLCACAPAAYRKRAVPPSYTPGRGGGPGIVMPVSAIGPQSAYTENLISL